jgi:hypothetical protein
MKTKAKKPEAIPLEEIFTCAGFNRNFKIMRKNPRDRDLALMEAINQELVSNASANVVSKQRHAKISAKGGQSTAKAKRDELKKRNCKIADAAKKLLSDGKAGHELSGILADRNKLSTKQIRTVLQSAGILKKTEVQ